MKWIVLLATVLMMASCSSSSATSAVGYGHDSAAEAKALGICKSPRKVSATIADCDFSNGTVAVAVVKDAAEQAQIVKLIPRETSGCVLVGKGFVVEGPFDVLSAHVDLAGIEKKFGARGRAGSTCLPGS